MAYKWFLIDLGNTVIRLAFDRALANICRETAASPEEVMKVLEAPRGYRDMERGAVTFYDFYEALCESAGYRGSIRDFHATWSDFFEGPVEGIKELLDRIRQRYRIAYLSNSNEVHAEVIPKAYGELFHPDEQFIFSHLHGVAKPDPIMFVRALEVVRAMPEQAVFIDDLQDNVTAARSLGIRSYLFTDAKELERALEKDGLLEEKLKIEKLKIEN